MPGRSAFDRRTLLTYMGAAGAVSLFPASAVSAPLVPTPGQTEGPFYPAVLPADADNDLVRVRGTAARALGKVTHLQGRILDSAGQPVPGAVVEIWQCDARGRYRHPRAPGQELFDDGFQGYGRTAAAGDGAYRFRTIRPVPYTGRTPHIHVAVIVPGTGRFVTQMYVEGEPLNERDQVLRRIRDPQARRSVIVRLDPAEELEAGSLKGTFDVVLERGFLR